MTQPSPNSGNHGYSHFLFFFQNLLKSVCWENRTLARNVSTDHGSSTGDNLLNLNEKFNLCPWTMSPASFQKGYNGDQVPTGGCLCWESSWYKGGKWLLVDKRPASSLVWLTLCVCLDLACLSITVGSCTPTLLQEIIAVVEAQQKLLIYNELAL